MSGGVTCKCTKPIKARGVVIDRQCNYSAFSGYHYTPSAYSRVACVECGTHWRTKAAYVRELPDADREHWIATGELRPAKESEKK